MPGNRCPPKNALRVRNLPSLSQEDRLTVVMRHQQTQGEQLQPFLRGKWKQKADWQEWFCHSGTALDQHNQCLKTHEQLDDGRLEMSPLHPSRPLWPHTVGRASCKWGLPATGVRQGWCPRVTPRPLRVFRGAGLDEFSIGKLHVNQCLSYQSPTLKNLAIADIFASLTKKGKKKEIHLSLT